MTNIHTAYYSNLCPAFPLSEQKAARPDSVFKEYTDEVDRRFRKSRKLPELLTDRASMLRPSSRKDSGTIWVKALPCLAVDVPDLLNALKQAQDRGQRIYVADNKLLITHTSDSWHRASGLLAAALNSAKISERGKAGGSVSGANRRAETASRLKPFEPFWGDPTRTIAAMAREAETSVNTFVGHMEKATGATRAVAIKQWKRAEARKTTAA